MNDSLPEPAEPVSEEEFYTFASENEKSKRGERKRKAKPGLPLALFPAILAIGFIGILVVVILFSIPAPQELERKSNTPMIIIPTAVATNVPTVYTKVWSGHPFLTHEEARDLRQQPNVINFAVLLPSGAVQYDATSSLLLTKMSPWTQVSVRPYGLETLTLHGTAVSLQINQLTYELNVYQPFFIDARPTDDNVYVIDEDGKLWQLPLDSVSLMLINDVVRQLPLSIAVNERLSFTY